MSTFLHNAENHLHLKEASPNSRHSDSDDSDNNQSHAFDHSQSSSSYHSSHQSSSSEGYQPMTSLLSRMMPIQPEESESQSESSSSDASSYVPVYKHQDIAALLTAGAIILSSPELTLISYTACSVQSYLFEEVEPTLTLQLLVAKGLQAIANRTRSKTRLRDLTLQVPLHLLVELLSASATYKLIEGLQQEDSDLYQRFNEFLKPRPWHGFYTAMASFLKAEDHRLDIENPIASMAPILDLWWTLAQGPNVWKQWDQEIPEESQDPCDDSFAGYEKHLVGKDPANIWTQPLDLLPKSLDDYVGVIVTCFEDLHSCNLNGFKQQQADKIFRLRRLLCERRAGLVYKEPRVGLDCDSPYVSISLLVAITFPTPLHLLAARTGWLRWGLPCLHGEFVLDLAQSVAPHKWSAVHHMVDKVNQARKTSAMSANFCSASWILDRLTVSGQQVSLLLSGSSQGIGEALAHLLRAAWEACHSLEELDQPHLTVCCMRNGLDSTLHDLQEYGTKDFASEGAASKRIRYQ